MLEIGVQSVLKLSERPTRFLSVTTFIMIMRSPFPFSKTFFWLNAYRSKLKIYFPNKVNTCPEKHRRTSCANVFVVGFVTSALMIFMKDANSLKSITLVTPFGLAFTSKVQSNARIILKLLSTPDTFFIFC